MDCFHCVLPDCTNNTLTTADRLESTRRDLLFTGESKVIAHAKTRNKKEYAKRDYRHKGIENLVMHREERKNGETDM